MVELIVNQNRMIIPKPNIVIPFIVLSITTIYSLQIVTDSISKEQLLRNHNIVLQVSIENKLQSTKRPLYINDNKYVSKKRP